MPVPSTTAVSADEARASAQVKGNTLHIEVGGTWRLRAARRPDAAAMLAEMDGDAWQNLVVTARDLATWDSSLLLFVAALRTRAAQREAGFTLQNLPGIFDEWLRELQPAATATDSPSTARARRRYAFPVSRTVGLWTRDAWHELQLMLGFLGESALGLGRVLRHPAAFRWADCLQQMRRCGAQALGVVSMITFLVGLIIAYVGAAQFRQIGADVFVADLVGLAIFRELGPMMTAIVLSGRTGAAYAAELGNMRLNEEIDALETFGVRAQDFLVTPRLLALLLMIPLLALYADFLGVLGGMLVAQAELGLTPRAFLLQMQTAVHLNDIATGLFKGGFFGLIIAYSGCLKGLHAQRSAVGVGEATTSAVVLAILLIIVADAGFTVLFSMLQW